VDFIFEGPSGVFDDNIMGRASEVAPVLCMPDTHVLETATPTVKSTLPRLEHEQLYITYEIKRTVDEIRAGAWKRIALQFPDHLLIDAPRVYCALSRGLKEARTTQPPCKDNIHEPQASQIGLDGLVKTLEESSTSRNCEGVEEKLYILADTSYGACCVDEVSAQHADADVVVHYGRACLSPTTRVPVIYCFTKPPLALDSVVQAFKNAFESYSEKIILMGDIPYCSYLPQCEDMLKRAGYSHVYTTDVVYDATSLLPNRTVPPEVLNRGAELLQEYHLFHISVPPPSLLLTLASRVAAIHIYPTSPPAKSTSHTTSHLASSTVMLRRRYALLTSLNTVPVFGILINTLSVKDYLPMLNYVKRQIADAGKKSYTFVVGKVNAAKVANFSEVGGWVVIGCWESSLFESKDFWKPVITPFELELALKGDAERFWTGEWTSNFQTILDDKHNIHDDPTNVHDARLENRADNETDSAEVGSDEDSEPPEFDLRTGRYVSHTRPMGRASTNQMRNSRDNGRLSHVGTLIKRADGALATIGGEFSPAADFFNTTRTWQGLGSDLDALYDECGALERLNGAAIEAGRTGIARGYAVGINGMRR